MNAAHRQTARDLGAALHRLTHTKPIADMHRQLAGRATETLKVNVIGCFTSPVGIQYRVLEDGQIYHINRHLLNTLRESDETCKSLEIIPVEEEEEAD
ncbi:hypothetical protein LRP31_25670 [Mesorhizobium mediterraneum]|uniref:Uncharacterized protein n=1 Tax=Mesorhizobium mediterraneum TaxID=43617 RepID=A0AB36RG83_9HYPH|nr:hypothetical protein [Mesorhizobium mediterraneum]PAQ03689.1 hypothetical protein CIT25_04015 [Mesorhizobium mediterraneum]WIW52412.1 hypothetical protein LRP31_25670 [Mesorhizobium mediterraneum]